jgi:hypothetical protein
LHIFGKKVAGSLQYGARMIVKVQVSQYTMATRQQMLIYDKKRSYYYEGNLTDEVRHKMGAKLKAYFYATLKDNHLVIDDEALAQVW